MAAKNGEFLMVNELTGKTLCMNCQSFDDQGLQFLFFWLHRQRMNYNVLLHKFWEVVGVGGRKGRDRVYVATCMY